jgi:hypothetical protein
MVKLSRCEVVELRRVLVFGGHYATPGITRTDTVTEWFSLRSGGYYFRTLRRSGWT